MGYNYGGKKMSDEDRKIVRESRGLKKIKICMKCNARNPENAEKCRKCGHTRLRKKAGKSEFEKREHIANSGDR